MKGEGKSFVIRRAIRTTLQKISKKMSNAISIDLSFCNVYFLYVHGEIVQVVIMPLKQTVTLTQCKIIGWFN